jgi:hypothetical protein
MAQKSFIELAFVWVGLLSLFSQVLRRKVFVENERKKGF